MVMRCASALSTIRNTDAAVRDVLDQLTSSWSGEPADLAFVFSSMHHADTLGPLSEKLTASGLGRHVLGCTGETIIGGDREVESEPALSVWTIRLPGANLRPIRLENEADAIEASKTLGNDFGHLLILSDPFSFAADPWLKRVNSDLPGLKVIGGVASAAQVPRQNRLVLDGQVFEDGAVALAMGGAVSVRTLVSQGCRPIGRHQVVTKTDRNVIEQLGRRPAMEVLRELYEDLPSEDQERVQSGLHIGRVINEYQDTFRRGDFLVRNVMGASDVGGIAISDVVRVGQTVQFHVRDAETADEDLRSLIESERLDRPDAQIAGALLFSCNGRGTRLFADPDHDIGVIHQILGTIPVAGFFAMGEIGPIGGQNFVHGYTASIILFESTDA